MINTNGRKGGILASNPNRQLNHNRAGDIVLLCCPYIIAAVAEIESVRPVRALPTPENSPKERGRGVCRGGHGKQTG